MVQNSHQDLWGVVPDHNYTFSLSVFVDPNTNAKSIELRMECGKTAIASEVVEVATIKRGEWMHFSVTGKPTLTAVRVMVIVEPLKSVKEQWERKGAIKFDDADFQRTETY